MTEGSKSCPHIGLILHRGRDALFDAFISAMSAHGLEDGRTVVIEPRFAEGMLERTVGFAAELVERRVDLIVAIGAVGAGAARKATATVPILFAIVLEPVQLGFAESWERPGGNMTGVTNFDPRLAGEQLAILRETVPGLTRVAVLSDADIPRPAAGNPLEQSCEAAAGKLGLALDWFRPRGPAPDWDGLFGEMKRRGCGAVVTLEVPVNIGNFAGIAALARSHRLPTMFPDGWQHDGLLSYGTSLLQTVQDLPGMAARILAGSAPGAIPIRQVRRHRLTVNRATARRIGIELPPGVLDRAEEIIG